MLCLVSINAGGVYYSNHIISSTYVIFDQSNGGVPTHLPLLARSNNNKNKREFCLPHLLPMKVFRVLYIHHFTFLLDKDNLKTPDSMFIDPYLFYIFCLYFAKNDIKPFGTSYDVWRNQSDGVPFFFFFFYLLFYVDTNFLFTNLQIVL